MVITHKIDMDLTNPGAVPRIQAKQGDLMTRNVIINLYAEGEAWSPSADTTAVIRYRVQDPDGMVTAEGMYDTMEDGSLAYLVLGNMLVVTPSQKMLAVPGLVTVDVLLIDGEKQLATFNFEIYVNRAAATGTDAENGGYYRVASLESINAELDTLRAAIAAMGGGSYLT